jgi:uncharacterized membrane protein
MTFFRILTEITGGFEIGIMLLVLFIIIFIVSSFYMVKKYNRSISTMKLSLGIVIYLLISATLSDVFLNTLLFSQGEYINYGLGGGLIRLLFSIIIGLLIGFSVTRLVYFKVVNKFLLN